MSITITEDRVSEQRGELSVSGRLTLAEAPELKNRINGLVASGIIQIILDLRALEFVDSSGLAVFVSALKRTRENGGWLKLYGVGARPREIFTLTRLDHVFDLFETREELLAGV